MLTCSKFLTTSDYAPRLRARLGVEQQLIEDATTRGWDREIERHTGTKTRIEALLTQLGEGGEGGDSAQSQQLAPSYLEDLIETPDPRDR